MPNNTPRDTKEAYAEAYQLHFSKLSKPLQDRVTAAKNSDTKDPQVNDFIKAVIATAEGSN